MHLNKKFATDGLVIATSECRMITKRHGICHGRQIQMGSFRLSKSECGWFLKQKSNLFWLLRESDAFEKRTLVERLEILTTCFFRSFRFQQLKGHMYTAPHRDRNRIMRCHRFHADEGLAWFTIHYSATPEFSSPDLQLNLVAHFDSLISEETQCPSQHEEWIANSPLWESMRRPQVPTSL